MNLKWVMAITMVLATAIIISNAYAQESLCDENGPTARGQALGIVCHTTQDPATMLIPAIPLITGLGIGIIAWIVVSARRVR